MELQEAYQTDGIIKNKDSSDFVTVVSVGSIESGSIEHPGQSDVSTEYVTVLKIGETQNESSCTSAGVAEEVSVYRLPGERLGFGLKFEGGTKASEYVKRLFIQSCAPDSPASRVRSSWGCLREGDEVIEIDSVPVKAMTRIDCVRCLKDSNVVIKLLVQRNDELEDAINSLDSSDHLPLVISAEKKRTPPPPPPVPPRKISRKILKDGRYAIKKTRISHENDESQTQNDNRIRQEHSSNKSRSSCFQQSTDATQRDQRNLTAEDATGPPDAEIYIDLLSQESMYYMSESDDTGSSISTVVDRFSSFPTTTSSSVCSSLPTTPTSIQKQMDLASIHNLCEQEEEENEVTDVSVQINNELFDQLNFRGNEIDSMQLNGQSELLYTSLEKLTTPLQPPTNFQDAPLSYGNEEIKLNTIAPIEAEEILGSEEKKETNQSILSPPPPPPRSKQLLIKNEKNNNNIKQEKLPRLVDYLPKSSHNETHDSDFSLKGESQISDDIVQPIHLRYSNSKEDLTECISMWDEEKSYPFQSFSKTSQLATIGEDEEFTQDKNNTRYNVSSPTVIIINDEKCSTSDSYDSPSDVVDEDIMEVPSISLGQLSDGHELLNYKELPILGQDKNKNNVQSIIAKFSTNIEYSIGENGYTTYPANNVEQGNNPEQVSDEQIQGITDSRLTPRSKDSQNITDIPVQNYTEDRWQIVGEQQTKRLSKLKGLIIPEQSIIEDIAVVDLPEIKTIPAKMIPPIETKHVHVNYQITNNSKNSSTPTLTTPIWNIDSFSTVPKYSPAFKRKHLQIFDKSDSTKVASVAGKRYTSDSHVATIDRFVKLPTKDVAKSLESIIVPAITDCNFERTSSSLQNLNKTSDQDHIENLSNVDKDSTDGSLHSYSIPSNDSPNYSELRQPECKSKLPQCITKNSSFQLLTCDNLNPRLLKPQSVEAINRKNILASAKCRSGQDLKVGSPLIKRKVIDAICETKDILQYNDEDGCSTVKHKVSNLPSNVNVKQFPDKNLAEKNRDVCIKSKEVVAPTTGVNNKRSYLSKNPNPTRVVDILKNFEKNVSHLNTLNKINSNISSSPKPVKIKKTPEHTELHKIENSENSNNEKQDSNESNNKDTQIIVLYPEVIGGSVGITLAGGTDYETKEITVHKVRCGSPAHRDGRLKKGDRILSINGKSMNGLTHDESIYILKENTATVTLVIGANEIETSLALPETKAKPITKISKIIDTEIEKANSSNEIVPNQEEITISLIKDSSGLGFSMEGGKDSSKGDMPLVIKKLFMGGVADRSNLLKVGDELININGTDVRDMARIDVWSLMKKIPDGPVAIKIRR